VKPLPKLISDYNIEMPSMISTLAKKENFISIRKTVGSAHKLHEIKNIQILAVLSAAGTGHGKRWLMQQIFRRPFEFPAKDAREGLRFFFNQSKVAAENWLILDLNVPPAAAAKTPSKAVVDPQDHVKAERFSYRVAGELADVVIFLVNDWTRYEQNQFNLIYSRSSWGSAVVVHNLKKSERIQDAEKLFSQQISAYYQGAKYLGGLRYQVSTDKSELEKKSLLRRVRHLGFAKEGKEAGKKFNAKNQDYLETMLRDSGTFMKPKEKKFVDLLVDAYKTLLLETFEAEDVKVEFRRDEQKPRLRIDWGRNAPIVKDESCPLINVFERYSIDATPTGNVTFAHRVVDIEAAGLTSKEVQLRKVGEKMKKCVLEMNFENWKNVKLEEDFGNSFRPGKKCKLDLDMYADVQLCADKKDPCYEYPRTWDFSCDANSFMEFEDGMLTLRAKRCRCESVAEGSEQ
jgi:hypothetical protein